MSLPSEIEDKIRSFLPHITGEILNQLVDLLSEVGADNVDDLPFVEESDLLKVLKPVQARKLLRGFQCDSDGPSSRSTSPSPSSSSSGSVFSPGSVRITNQDPNWPQKMTIPWNKVPEITFNLKSNKKLEPDSRKKLVRVVVDEVREITSHAYKRQFETIAMRMVAMYPSSLEDQIDGVTVGSGYDSLVYQIINRNENLNRNTGKLFRKRKSDNFDDDTDQKKPAKTPPGKKVRDSYGCVNWGPDVDADDDELDKIKKQLKEMHNKVPSDWVTEQIVEFMNKTYCLQRQAINDGESIGKLLEDWPFLSEPVGILCHFKTLVGIDCEAAIREGCDSKGLRLQRYFTSDMRGEMDNLFQAAKREADNNNVKAWIPANLLCIMKCLNEKPEALFLLVDETASVAEVERDNKESWPRLVMLGESYLSTKEYMIIVDHKVIVRTGISSFLRAVAVLFSTFYVFNIQFQSGAAATLEFLQRCFCKINPDKGCKADRKRKSTGVNPKVLKMINSIAGFEWTPLEQ